MMTRPALPPESADAQRQDPGDAAWAAPPVADGDCVRFTYFFGVRGPQVFEVPWVVLQALGARSVDADDMLRVVGDHEREIAQAARRHRDAHGHAVIVLEVADFAHVR